MKNLEEKWVSINGYEDHYEISNLGRVRSKDRYVKMKWNDNSYRFCKGIVKESTPHYKNKYRSVMLKVGQVEKRVFIHRLVAEHFISNPDNKLTVNHKDGNKDNNSLLNLEWSTQQENNQHAIDTGLVNNGIPVVLIKDTSILEFNSKRECASFLNMNESFFCKKAKSNKQIKGFTLCV